jgi:hypothetical protein
LCAVLRRLRMCAEQHALTQTACHAAPCTTNTATPASPPDRRHQCPPCPAAPAGAVLAGDGGGQVAQQAQHGAL